MITDFLVEIFILTLWRFGFISMPIIGYYYADRHSLLLEVLPNQQSKLTLAGIEAWHSSEKEGLIIKTALPQID
jgi:hypothetical protein